MEVFTTFICFILQWEHSFLQHESTQTSQLLLYFYTIHVICSQERRGKGAGMAPYDSVPGFGENIYSLKGKTLKIKTIILIKMTLTPYIFNLAK